MRDAADVFATGVLPPEVHAEFVRLTPVAERDGRLVELQAICFPRSAFVAAVAAMTEAVMPGAVWDREGGSDPTLN